MSDDLLPTLLDRERELASGTGDTYRSMLTDDAIVIVPGARLDREQCAAAIDASPGWDRFTLDDAEVLQAGDGALITYTFDGDRAPDLRYRALMSSLYVSVDGDWRLAFHQQTPLGDDEA